MIDMIIWKILPEAEMVLIKIGNIELAFAINFDEIKGYIEFFKMLKEKVDKL